MNLITIIYNSILVTVGGLTFIMLISYLVFASKRKKIVSENRGHANSSKNELKPNFIDNSSPKIPDRKLQKQLSPSIYQKKKRIISRTEFLKTHKTTRLTKPSLSINRFRIVNSDSDTHLVNNKKYCNTAIIPQNSFDLYSSKI